MLSPRGQFLSRTLAMRSPLDAPGSPPKAAEGSATRALSIPREHRAGQCPVGQQCGERGATPAQNTRWRKRPGPDLTLHRLLFLPTSRVRAGRRQRPE